MTIRVKLVMSTNMAGATDSTVSTRIITTTLEPPPSVRSGTLMSIPADPPGIVGVGGDTCAEAGEENMRDVSKANMRERDDASDNFNILDILPALFYATACYVPKLLY